MYGVSPPRSTCSDRNMPNRFEQHMYGPLSVIMRSTSLTSRMLAEYFGSRYGAFIHARLYACMWAFLTIDVGPNDIISKFASWV